MGQILGNLDISYCQVRSVVYLKFEGGRKQWIGIKFIDKEYTT